MTVQPSVAASRPAGRRRVDDRPPRVAARRARDRRVAAAGRVRPVRRRGHEHAQLPARALRRRPRRTGTCSSATPAARPAGWPPAPACSRRGRCVEAAARVARGLPLPGGLYAVDEPASRRARAARDRDRPAARRRPAAPTGSRRCWRWRAATARTP